MFTEKALDWIGRLSRSMKIDVHYVADPSTFGAWREERGVNVPYPHTPGDYAIFLHEVGHVIFRDVARSKGWKEWQTEACASRWAIDAYETTVSERKQEGVARLARNLHGYLTWALARGEATADQIERRVPRELIAYPEDVFITTPARDASENGHRSWDDGPLMWGPAY